MQKDGWTRSVSLFFFVFVIRWLWQGTSTFPVDKLSDVDLSGPVCWLV